MDKVYILFNSDINDVMAVSRDKDLINEMLCDYFMSDVEYQWYWEQYHSPYNDEALPDIAREIWRDMIDWYDAYIYVYERRIVE